MADNDSFGRGKKAFPLATGTGNTVLKDADPFVDIACLFLASVLETYLGPRLAEAASFAGVSARFPAAVAMVVPLDPVPQLQSTHLKFPLLGVYRVGGNFKDRTIGYRQDESVFEIVYVFPPLNMGEAVQMVPLLTAARDILDARVDLGSDPSFTPTGGDAGDAVWLNDGGAGACWLTDYEIGAFEGERDLTFYALRLRGFVAERSFTPEGQYEDLRGVDGTIALTSTSDGSVVANVADASTWPDPTVTLAAPATGSIAGGTLVTLTGTRFRVGTPAYVQLARKLVAATVVNATTATFTTPAIDTAVVTDVTFIDDAGAEALLADGFTFTAP